jgi:hypothetical protein
VRGTRVNLGHADDDAARVEASMVGVANRDAEAVQALLKVVDA